MESNRSTIFCGATVVAIVAIAIAIYYAVPGVHHMLVTDNPTGFHLKPMVAFPAFAVIGIFAALINRPQFTTK